MQNILDVIITRRAIRRFRAEQIDEAALEKILEAGLYAPSGGNNQRPRIVVCQNPGINERLGKLSRYMQFKEYPEGYTPPKVSAEQPSIRDDVTILNGFYDAPTVLTIFALKQNPRDAYFVAQNVMLAAHALGVASCFVCRTEEVFDTDYGRELMAQWGIEEDLTAVCNVCLGYRKGPAPGPKPRKPNRIIRIK